MTEQKCDPNIISLKDNCSYKTDNAWFSSYDESENCIVKPDICPKGYGFVSEYNEKLKVCEYEINEDELRYKDEAARYCDNKWYEWFVIPNYHLGNTRELVPDKTSKESNILRFYPCGYEPENLKINFEQIPYRKNNNIGKCVNKGLLYHDINAPYSPLAVICLLGSLLPYKEETHLSDYYKLLYSNHLNSDGQNEDLGIMTKQDIETNIKTGKDIIKYVAESFLNLKNVSIIPDEKADETIKRFTNEQLIFAYDVSVNVSNILADTEGIDKLKKAIRAHYGFDDLKVNKHFDLLIKACEYATSQNSSKSSGFFAFLFPPQHFSDKVLSRIERGYVDIVLLDNMEETTKTAPKGSFYSIRNRGVFASFFGLHGVKGKPMPYKVSNTNFVILQFIMYIIIIILVKFIMLLFAYFVYKSIQYTYERLFLSSDQIDGKNQIKKSFGKQYQK